MEHKNLTRPIVIHPHLLQKFMRHEKDFANLLALYCFYLYHAQVQKTNQALATDEFTRNGMKWAIDRVKRVKKILKEMKVIEMVQVRQYTYVHLLFIYTKKKIDEIFKKDKIEAPEITKQGESESSKTDTKAEKKAPESQKSEEKESPKEEKEKSVFEQMLIKNKINQKRIDRTLKAVVSLNGTGKYRFSQVAFAWWITYFEQRELGYNKGNVKHWLEAMDGRTSIEQKEVVFEAREKRWKDIFFKDIEKSPYNKLLGSSLMLDRDCDTLLDIDKEGKRFVYYFKNTTIRTEEPPQEIFKRAGYLKSEEKTAPIAPSVKDKIMSCFTRV